MTPDAGRPGRGRGDKRPGNRGNNIARSVTACNGSDPYVFVSYSHADSDVVFAEIAGLNAARVNVWYDEGIAAEDISVRLSRVDRHDLRALAASRNPAWQILCVPIRVLRRWTIYWRVSKRTRTSTCRSATLRLRDALMIAAPVLASDLSARPRPTCVSEPGVIDLSSRTCLSTRSPARVSPSSLRSLEHLYRVVLCLLFNLHFIVDEEIWKTGSLPLLLSAIGTGSPADRIFRR